MVDIRNSAAQMTRMAGGAAPGSILVCTNARARPKPASLARDLNPSETALILVDFQISFYEHGGRQLRAVIKELEEKQCSTGRWSWSRRRRTSVYG